MAANAFYELKSVWVQHFLLPNRTWNIHFFAKNLFRQACVDECNEPDTAHHTFVKHFRSHKYFLFRYWIPESRIIWKSNLIFCLLFFHYQVCWQEAMFWICKTSSTHNCCQVFFWSCNTFIWLEVFLNI